MRKARVCLRVLGMVAACTIILRFRDPALHHYRERCCLAKAKQLVVTGMLIVEVIDERAFARADVWLDGCANLAEARCKAAEWIASPKLGPPCAAGLRDGEDRLGVGLG